MCINSSFPEFYQFVCTSSNHDANLLVIELIELTFFFCPFITSGKIATAQTAKEWPVNVMLHFLLTQTFKWQRDDQVARFQRFQTCDCKNWFGVGLISLWYGNENNEGRLVSRIQIDLGSAINNKPINEDLRSLIRGKNERQIFCFNSPK